MACKNLTDTEKQTLVDQIANVLMVDALSREEYIEILRICAAACDRRISELQDSLRPYRNVQ